MFCEIVSSRIVMLMKQKKEVPSSPSQCLLIFSFANLTAYMAASFNLYKPCERKHNIRELAIRQTKNGVFSYFVFSTKFLTLTTREKGSINQATVSSSLF